MSPQPHSLTEAELPELAKNRRKTIAVTAVALGCVVAGIALIVAAGWVGALVLLAIMLLGWAFANDRSRLMLPG